MLIIPAVGSLGQENQEFKVCLGYTVRLSQKKEKEKNSE
jgi:hypothetical protein